MLVNDPMGGGWKDAGRYTLRRRLRGIISAAVAIAFIWLVFKLGKLADAYTEKLKGKAQ